MIINSIVYFIICFLQPIILPLPEPFTIMTGSAILGRFNGAVVGFLGTILGILTMYFISRYASEKFLFNVIKKEKLEKFNEYIRKNEILIILMLFIFPVLPDEVICIGSGLANINIYKFITISCVAKLITVFTLSYSIEVFKFNIQTLIICFLLIVIFMLVKYIFQTKKSRKKVNLKTN